MTRRQKQRRALAPRNPSPAPKDDSIGWLEEKVRAELTEKGLAWEGFAIWIFGQTVAIDSQGRRRYYPWDVMKYINSPSCQPLD